MLEDQKYYGGRFKYEMFTLQKKDLNYSAEEFRREDGVYEYDAKD